MKITSFNPLILTKDAESAIKMFEELGFGRRHTITINENGKDITTGCINNPAVFRVDVSQVDDLPRDMTLIRINVDDFDEAYKFFASKGFKNPKGENHSVDTRTNRSAMLSSPSGFAFDLCQHIKE